MTPLVSIAMCTYNGERFLKEQLESILNQTYKNIELIITDDCSKDTTVEIIKEYQKSDSRIKLYQNENNLGFVKNFEKAISLCKGEYITLSDQDDIWKLEKIETYVNEIGENMLIYSDAELIDQFSNKLNSNLIVPKYNLVSGKCNKVFLFDNIVSGNTIMFRRELTEKILPIPPEFSFHDIWIVFIASTIGTITYTKEPMIFYRRYDEQVTRRVEKTYKSFYDKFKQKKETKTKNAQSKIIDLESYSRLTFLDDEVRKIIDVLLAHLKNYSSNYFNKELFNILRAQKDEIFAIRKVNRRMKHVRKASMKLKLYEILLFAY